MQVCSRFLLQFTRMLTLEQIPTESEVLGNKVSHYHHLFPISVPRHFQDLFYCVDLLDYRLLFAFQCLSLSMASVNDCFVIFPLVELLRERYETITHEDRNQSESKYID